METRNLMAVSRTMIAIGLALILPLLSGCDTIVGGMINTVNRADYERESNRLTSISQQSVARYKAMADAGDPKGLYFMAVVHAAKHMNDPGQDAVNVKRMYEEAMAKGSNDAKVALGNMLICGSSGIQWGGICLEPPPGTDPKRGLALLKEAAEKSCSVTEPLIAIGNCRERERSIAEFLWLIYRDGDGGIPKDPVQQAYWEKRDEMCRPLIDAMNHQRGCYE